MTNSTSLFQ